jgi:hypothetical protein
MLIKDLAAGELPVFDTTDISPATSSAIRLA